MKQVALTALILTLASAQSTAQVNAGAQASDTNLPFNVAQVATFNLPWRLDFLPDGRMLVTEKVGRVQLVTPQDDAVRMLADALNTPELDTLHVLGHGAPGEVILGGQRIDADAMPALKSQLQHTATETHSIDTQICLWFCRTGAEIGRAHV